MHERGRLDDTTTAGVSVGLQLQFSFRIRNGDVRPRHQMLVPHVQRRVRTQLQRSATRAELDHEAPAGTLTPLNEKRKVRPEGSAKNGLTCRLEEDGQRSGGKATQTLPLAAWGESAESQHKNKKEGSQSQRSITAIVVGSEGVSISMK